jgi:hypothetical protein
MGLSDRLGVCAAFCTLAMFGMALPPATEYDLKAAYLLNVLRFTEHKPPVKDNPFLTICLLAPGPIEKPLEAIGNRVVQGRKLRLRQIGRKEELPGCDVVFIGRSSGHRAMLERANALGALTIGNDSDFIPMSGMMALIVENHRIVVEINQGAIARPDWVISSHLLELARISGGER